MAVKEAEYLWMDGKLVKWRDATVHVLTHALHYGSSVFEGMRCYATGEGPACFRLGDHVRRLYDSAKIYRMEIPYAADEIKRAVQDTILANALEGCYVRPLVFRGYGDVGVNPLGCPTKVVIATWEWGAYLGKEALEQGVDVRVSSWTRLAPNTLPALAKAGANYMNSQLVKMEAVLDDYAEGIMLNSQGFVCEGSGENLFAVRDGVLSTPPLSASVLPGITRDSVMTLARDAGFEVREEAIVREFLYLADEVFFTGSAAEVTPIRSIDKVPVGNGRRGPITEKLQDAFSKITSGQAPDRWGWLTPVKPAAEPATS